MEEKNVRRSQNITTYLNVKIDGYRKYIQKHTRNKAGIFCTVIVVFQKNSKQKMVATWMGEEKYKLLEECQP